MIIKLEPGNYLINNRFVMVISREKIMSEHEELRALQSKIGEALDIPVIIISETLI